MKRILQSDSCCIDIGAHKGSILREILQISPHGTHFAFEPLPHLSTFLRNNFPTVRVYETALSDHNGTEQFIYVENAAGYSGLRPRIYDRPDPVLKKIMVTVTRLDDAIPKDHPIAFIKLDIEGGEFHALRGAISTIQRCRPVIIFEAGLKSTGQYGVTPEDLYRLTVEELGYRLSTMKRWLTNQPQYSQAEFVQNWHEGPDYYFIAYT